MSEDRAVVGPVPEGRDPDAYDRVRWRVLWALPTGLYILGASGGGRRNLMTVSWVTQVATSPKLVGVGVQSDAVTHALLVEGGVFALSLVAREDRAVVRHFVKPLSPEDVAADETGETMRGTPVRTGVTGAPILRAAPAWVECQVRHTLDLGSHGWFVGEVVDAGFGAGGEDAEMLRMEDTRMSYGG